MGYLLVYRNYAIHIAMSNCASIESILIIFYFNSYPLAVNTNKLIEILTCKD